ncbi:Pleiotropic drug resistance protein 3 [Apostasia shenzhenica]|uniref:Pleiotropic drug resistance protein 3 n=1 Tax=Apostasia shenzhenica TaxID=1088818 RepID=A0A2I0AJT1_9ASPA|nr:Pleiotropic drug resistance protein 3 [Apostasia shenzhenica]
MERPSSEGHELEESGRPASKQDLSGQADTVSGASGGDDGGKQEEVEIQWAAIERLPTAKRLRWSLFQHGGGAEEDDGIGSKRIVDVASLGDIERRLFMKKLIRDVEEDNRRLLEKQRERMASASVKLPSIEVKFKNLSVEAQCEVVAKKPLPTLWNTLKEALKGVGRACGVESETVNVSILKNVSGVIKPSRLTLLLGPPGSGKTTLLLSLAGQMRQLPQQLTGDITYNGEKLEKTFLANALAYISQKDQHIPEMTVRETLDFAARCQGIGCRADIMMEVARHEKRAGVIPNPDIDTYMKVEMKILGLEACSGTLVGDAIRRGISGGQKRRLTTGEMMVGPSRAFFMDEISNGLDSSTAFQIISCIQQYVHITEATALISLLQPTPETFNLFDDIMLMARGKIIYHGPRDHILGFFEECGFRCPPRKGIADFLQEVISENDQAQYWYQKDKPYIYITTDEFSEMFQSSSTEKKLEEELSEAHDKYKSNRDAYLTFNTSATAKWEVFKTCMEREFLLLKRNSFVHMFKTIQIAIIAIMTMTVFLHTQRDLNLVQASYYFDSLRYTIIRLVTNGIAELTLSLSRLPVFYKQRDFRLYPAWAYSIPASLLKIPFSIIESFIWTALTYYPIGYSPEIQRDSFPVWLRWVFWFSPTTYAEIGLSINEFQAPRWEKLATGNVTLGKQVLKSHGLNFEGNFYWLSIGALLIFTLLFNLSNTVALASGRIVMPFQPLTMTFQDIQYFIDIPKGMNRQGYGPRRLQLLQNLTGAFRPGVLSAIMGVSGAGKTTLMDVLCGRKTCGIIEGDIRIDGYPKAQETFARISGYCEQNDYHSPQITVAESIIYSAWLRHPPEINQQMKAEFVEAVLKTMELQGVKDALVGTPGINGLSTEKRKRLTIAVELVANPSILFLDEPTTGLDARAAAIVMRAVKNIVETGRTVVCTIHQPSIDIFESFDELLLMKKGGQLIYNGPLGENSRKLIQYFEKIPGVPKIKEHYNPATWMLEVTSVAMERHLGINFADVYQKSTLYQNNEQELFSIMGSMYLATIFLGINNCTAVLPIIASERIVFYRERFARMYASYIYSLAQVAAEIPYSLILAAIYVIITYPAIGYFLSSYKIFWYFYVSFCTLLYYNYLGMLIMSLSRNTQVAAVLASACYAILNLFAGYLIPKPRIPQWWIWLYLCCPTSWTLNGFMTSQYGDITTEIKAFGETKALNAFLKDYYGFHQRDLSFVRFILVLIPVTFASLFLYHIGKLNFQRK